MQSHSFDPQLVTHGKGTPKNLDIRKEMTERGARRSANTFPDRTNYFETVPASDANLLLAFS